MILLLSLGARLSWAQGIPERGLTLTVGVTAQWDSNILRLGDGTTPKDLGFDASSNSDRVINPYAIVEGLLEAGRQRFVGRLYYSPSRFNTFDLYDTDLLNYRAAWLWQLGNEWDGELVAAQEQTNSDFQDFLGVSRNVLSVRSQRATANYRPRPDRRASLSFDALDGTNSVPVRAFNNFEISATRLELGAATGAGNDVSISYRYTSGLYPNRAITENFPIDNSYKQADADLGIVWQISERTRLAARMGYGWRRFDEVSARDFAGPVGQFVFAWQASSKLRFDASAVRDLGALEDLDSLYAVSTNLRAAVRYDFRPKWSLSASYLQRNIDYAGDPETFLSDLLRLSLPERKDTIREGKIALLWSPVSRWVIELAQLRVERDSNRLQYDYSANIFQFTTQYQFGP